MRTIETETRLASRLFANFFRFEREIARFISYIIGT